MFGQSCVPICSMIICRIGLSVWSTISIQNRIIKMFQMCSSNIGLSPRRTRGQRPSFSLSGSILRATPLWPCLTLTSIQKKGCVEHEVSKSILYACTIRYFSRSVALHLELYVVICITMKQLQFGKFRHLRSRQTEICAPPRPPSPRPDSGSASTPPAVGSSTAGRAPKLIPGQDPLCLTRPPFAKPSQPVERHRWEGRVLAHCEAKSPEFWLRHPPAPWKFSLFRSQTQRNRGT